MKREKDYDFSNYIPIKKTNKEKLINECKKMNISIYIDNTLETSTGIYGQLREVASEAELENRIMKNKTVETSKKSLIISTLSLVISILSIGIAIYQGWITQWK